MRRFAREIGITPGGLSGILTGRSKNLSGMFVKNLEYRFNINPLWLETGAGQTYVKKFVLEDTGEIDLVLKFRKLEKNQKNSILMMTNALYQNISPENSPKEMVAETRRKKPKHWQ